MSKPTEEGWYWYTRPGGTPHIYHVAVRPGHSYMAAEDEPNPITGKRQFLMVDKMPGEWRRETNERYLEALNASL